MALPTRARPSFSHSQSLPSGSLNKLLILLYQRTDRMKTIITENQPKWSHRSHPGVTQWNYEPCAVGPPKMDRSWWRVLTKRGSLEKGMAYHFSFLALRTLWTVWKGKKIWHCKMNHPRPTRLIGVQYATGEEWRDNSIKNEEAEPKRKQCPFVDVAGDETKVWCSKKLYCIGNWDVRSMNQGKLGMV